MSRCTKFISGKTQFCHACFQINQNFNGFFYGYWKIDAKIILGELKAKKSQDEFEKEGGTTEGWGAYVGERNFHTWLE